MAKNERILNRLRPLFQADSLRIDRGPSTVVTIFLCGLFASQLIGTLQVWFSNQALHANLKAMAAAGYFTIPTALIAPPIDSILAALGGGLFFTLTVGSGITLVVFCITCIWVLTQALSPNRLKRPPYSAPSQDTASRARSYLKLDSIFLTLLWGWLIFNLNRNGICLIESLYFLIIPIIVAVLTYRWITRLDLRELLRQIMLAVAPIILLTLIWTTQWDENLFVRVRDHLLLESKFGRVVNDFYYRYTLYPAEAFKPLSQKMLKTCYVEKLEDPRSAVTIERALRTHEYLVIADRDVADLRLHLQNSTLTLRPRSAEPVKIQHFSFINDPKSTLETVSLQADTSAFFRRLIFYGLLFGFPITLFVLLYGPISWFLGRWISSMYADLMASVLCFLTGLALFWPVWQSNTPPELLGDLTVAMTADRWQTRVAALQTIDLQKQPMPRKIQYDKSLKSKHISERYWLARMLAHSRSPQAYKDLLRLLKDPHPNVRCQAFYSLGNRQQRAAIQPITNAIRSTDHWYTQWYGYKALRRLGWVQPRSKLKLS